MPETCCTDLSTELLPTAVKVDVIRWRIAVMIAETCCTVLLQVVAQFSMA